MNANFFSSPSGRQLCCTLHTLQQLTCPQKKRVNFNGLKLSIKLLNIVNHCFEQHTFVSCGSRISRWGAPTSDVYAFQRKCMQKQKNWILLGGARSDGAPWIRQCLFGILYCYLSMAYFEQDSVPVKCGENVKSVPSWITR